MKRHFYLHTSDLDIIASLHEDPNFKHYYEYHAELNHTSINEIGMIEKNGLFFHFIVGHIPKNKCPWCNTEPTLLKVKDANYSMGIEDTRVCYVMECPKCGSRGPVMGFQEPVLFIGFYEYVEKKTKGFYSVRLAWDHDLKNPYEDVK